MEPRTLDQFADHYSPRNVMVLAMAGATEVAGYREWQDLGRQVRRGEHGIALQAPATRKDPDTGEVRVVGMKTAYVFDVSQTDELTPDELEALQQRRAEKRGRRKAAV